MALLCVAFLMNSNMPSELSENSPISTGASAYVDSKHRRFYAHSEIRNFYPASHLAGHSFAVKRADSEASVADLTEILERGQLRILTTRQHSVDYAGRSNSPEKQMLDDYAREMGLTPVMIHVREASKLVPELLAGNGDLIIGATPLFMTETHRLVQTSDGKQTPQFL